MNHTPEVIDRIIADVRRFNAPEPEGDGLARLIRLGIPLMSAEDANKRVIDLECELIRVKAELDRERMVKLWDEWIKP